MFIVKKEWSAVLKSEFTKEYFVSLQQFLKEEYIKETIFPNQPDIFNAFEYTPYSEVKVVILGQDPYHGPNQAHGLSFSVQSGEKLPPSLKNIYKELHIDIGCDIGKNGCLVKWAEQGVLLLNTVLTVKQGEPNSHKGIGWETFTDRVIEKLNERKKPIVFILWGRHAQTKEALIQAPHHYIIKSPHPSPLSANRGFFGSKPFSKINRWLMEKGEEPIDWQIE
ncbi:uracil-DNA glycosylase [Alkalihalobacterium alkalinitrilicum]|uniref:uracil-DNA glycosylase n=1 Tax=Alkalihalobacterium alkalinitrilicum TaxID=427920 RepID=UPI0009959FDE|nr:uracil-DNA glycosylase [Alkalihalobacterium alkalinitrilicum]